MELGTCNGDREFPISQIQIGGDTFVGDTFVGDTFVGDTFLKPLFFVDNLVDNT